jgi:hypothetical protein
MLTNTVDTVSQTTTSRNNHVKANKTKSSLIRQILYTLAGTSFVTSCFLSGYCFHTYLDNNLSYISFDWMLRAVVTNNTNKQNIDTKANFIRPGGPKRKRKKLLPNGWETYKFEQVYDHFHCSSHSNDDNKPIPSLDHWIYLRKQYKEYVDGNASFNNDPIPPTQGYTLENNQQRAAPFYAKLSPGKGRGIFASRDIKKGELVHDGSNSDVVFPDGNSFRRFIFALPRTMACDVMEWTWTQQFQEGGDYHICLAINISSLMNTGDDDEEANALPKSSTSTMFYATKDIKKDEEILTDYEIYDTDWSAVGMD